MDKIITIIVAVTMVSQLVLARSYGGFDRHSDFHHSFEHPDPPGWHHGWQPSMHGIYHGHYQRQFPRGSGHLDKEYWHAHRPDNYERRHDWYHDTSGGAYDRYPMWQMWQWQQMPSSWNEPQGNRFTTTTTTVSTPVNSQQQVQACIRSCPTTPEYNPVCGSNNVTYTNPGRLECARFCGVDVVLQRRASCSVQTTQAPFTPTPTATTTIPPITPPFRPTNQPDQSSYPNIDLSIFTSTTEPSTISPDVLASVFPKPDDSNADIDIDIDIRTRGGVGNFDQ